MQVEQQQFCLLDFKPSWKSGWRAELLQRVDNFTSKSKFSWLKFDCTISLKSQLAVAVLFSLILLRQWKSVSFKCLFLFNLSVEQISEFVSDFLVCGFCFSSVVINTSSSAWRDFLNGLCWLSHGVQISLTDTTSVNGSKLLTFDISFTFSFCFSWTLHFPDS